MTVLRIATSPAWVETVLADFDRFLNDHAAAEKKASGMALSMLAHYPDKTAIVTSMVALAIEELNHFREVIKRLHQRGLTLAPDRQDAYIHALHKQQRKGTAEYLLDRLLIGSVVEARGCERFGLLAAALPGGELKQFYTDIATSEAKHDDLFIELAHLYFPTDTIAARLDQLLDAEAEIITTLPIVAALH
jgi:tRNA 2-(methylsulfanyl)-N6-isopentenyladenosine37 hydroxylase